MHGLFIVIYGINNIGKTTQAKKLVEHLLSKGFRAEYLKYPLYDSPTGKQISAILRSGKQQRLTELEFQRLYFQNRKGFDAELRHKLKHGIIIVAEDYIGTSLAWGSAKGADEQELRDMNKELMHEDLAVLMDGKRFTDAIETGHLHESDNALVEMVRKRHLELAKKEGWAIVNANQLAEKVFQDILAVVLPNVRG